MMRLVGSYLEYQGSHDGRATFRVIFERQKRSGKSEHIEAELKLSRSSLYCINVAMKRFAKAEREAVDAMGFKE